MSTHSETAPQRGLTIGRRFTTAVESVRDSVRWERRTAEIKGDDGKLFFEQKDVEVPADWSQLATNVVVSKYFYGDPHSTLAPEQGGRESSVWQLITRVTGQIADWGRADGYFATDEDAAAFRDELTYLCLHQYGAFNSPVWFNCGLYRSYGTRGDNSNWRWDKAAGRVVPVAPGEAYKYPQCSACFIQSVDDTLEGIMALACQEASLFKYGSGSGTDLSTLRSSKEKLSGGGKPSGPVSFMRVYDAVASVIKSGGKTRRAAKMQTLSCDHPDIVDFIECKVKEEDKALALIRQGYSADFNGEAYGSVMFQNSNISVRLTDRFLRMAEEGVNAGWLTKGVADGRDYPLTESASNLLDKVAASTWRCGDPGVQYTDTLNRWHTTPNGPDGRSTLINSSNPCSEYVSVDNSACNLASINLIRFLAPDGVFDVDGFRSACVIFLLAQEILVDNSSYPTDRIAATAHSHRQLGLGYCNLGALLMAMGEAYDSAGGRSLGGAITAILGGQAYLSSAQTARRLGVFEAFERNREPMLRVIGQHLAACRQGCKSAAHAREQRLWECATEAWTEAAALGAEHGYRNAQVTVLAPTGCATPDTLVLTDRGLRRLGRLGDTAGEKWQDVDFSVQTDEGPRKAAAFFVNGMADVIELRTKRGYSFRATPKHQVKVVGPDGEWAWRKLSEIREGDVVPMRIGGMTGDPVPVPLPGLPPLDPRATAFVTPPRMTRELAELVGAFMANGSLHAKGIRISVFRRDEDLAARTVELFAEVFGLRADVVPEGPEVVSVVANSTPLARWWQAAGFAKQAPSADHSGKGYKAHVPDSVLETNDPLIYAAFLRGVIDHDGTVALGVPEFQSASLAFISDLKGMALALGFPTRLRSTISQKSGRPMWRASLLSVTYVSRWMELVGFTSARKTELVDVLGGHGGKNDHVYLPREVLDRVCPIRHPSRPAALMSVGRVGAISRDMAKALLRETGDPDLAHRLEYFYDRVATARLCETQQPTYDLSVPDNVTYLAGGLISHNTIAFMMDADTTGIEPDIALVKYKKLAGGGMLKIVNQTVPLGLKTLGYSPEAVRAITEHIDAHDTIEGAPGLKDEHLDIFDCAFPPPQGGRSIGWRGHVGMMAAAQPFLSGAISKSVNLPKEATPADIKNTYIEAWKLGLKAVAIYRDGSKESQPLSTKKDDAPAEVAAPAAKPAPRRERLPDSRAAINHKFTVEGTEGYVNVGLFPDGRPGELFIRVAKNGSTISGLLDTVATLTSMALQYGVPLEVLVGKFAHTRFAPAGFTKNPDIPIATSIVDYVFRWLGMEFLEGYRAANAPKRDEDEPREDALSWLAQELGKIRGGDTKPVATRALALAAGGNGHAPAGSQADLLRNADTAACPECGGIAVRRGTCYACQACGTTSGCG